MPCSIGSNRADHDLRSVAKITFDCTSVLSRFESTGRVSLDDARALGLVGPVARASGLARDVRQDHAAGIYRFAHIPVAIVGDGDVMARAFERWLEIERSITFVREQLAQFPEDPEDEENQAIAADPGRKPAPGLLSVALVEGWRGEIVHSMATADDGSLVAADVVDPSLHNWFGLALALRGNQISDFPLCNKSFNLSYAGHDL